MSTGEWWSDFFDDEYLRLWGPTLSDERSDAEADGVWTLLGLEKGSRVLDAPCGFGRLSRRIAARGGEVLGVDRSQRMIGEAGAYPGVRYLKHDLREALSEDGFDAAYNVFSSIGYDGEEGDRAVFRSVHAALKPGGKFLVETRHRDSVVLEVHTGMRSAGRFGDGTLMIEELSFDPISGRVDTVWHFAGPRGSASKPASFRMYAPTELVSLLSSCGFRFVSAHAGLSTAPFTSSVPYPRRVAILCERV